MDGKDGNGLRPEIKKFGLITFQVLMLSQQKIQKNLLIWIALFKNILLNKLTVYQEHLCTNKTTE